MWFALIVFRSNFTHIQSPASPSQTLEVEEFVVLSIKLSYKDIASSERDIKYLY